MPAVQLTIVNDETPEFFYRFLDIDILARTIWGMARDEDVCVKKAIACSIRNRVLSAQSGGPSWWGRTYIQVCQKPYEYRCWNTGNKLNKRTREVTSDDALFAYSLRLAEEIIEETLTDTVSGGTHFFKVDKTPHWVKDATVTRKLQQYAFCKI